MASYCLDELDAIIGSADARSDVLGFTLMGYRASISEVKYWRRLPD